MSVFSVFCQNDECRWNQNGECGRDVISIDYDNECQDFESYLDDAEWQKPFWKRMIDTETNQIYRVLFHGKEIEINGLKFFVEVSSSYASATEESTGLNCGERDRLESRIEKIIEKIAKGDIPPLETFPIGEYDKKTRRVKPQQAEQKGGE